MAGDSRLDDCLSTRGGRLYVEDCDTLQLLDRFGSPLFVLSEDQLRRNVRRFQRAFQAGWPDGSVKVLPAAKANWISAVQRILAAEGCGCDVYSAGAILYEALAGEPPLKAETIENQVYNILRVVPVPPDVRNPAVPEGASALVLRCLEKDRERRFPNFASLAVAVGEETGALDAMLGKVADFYDNEVDDTVNALTSLIEPLLIIVMGVVVGGILISLYLPMFNIANLINN